MSRAGPPRHARTAPMRGAVRSFVRELPQPVVPRGDAGGAGGGRFAGVRMRGHVELVLLHRTHDERGDVVRLHLVGAGGGRALLDGYADGAAHEGEED